MLPPQLEKDQHVSKPEGCSPKRDSTNPATPLRPAANTDTATITEKKILSNDGSLKFGSNVGSNAQRHRPICNHEFSTGRSDRTQDRRSASQARIVPTGPVAIQNKHAFTTTVGVCTPAQLMHAQIQYRVGEKVRLLLVVALEAENVAGLDDALENLRRGFRGNKLSFRESADAAHAFRLVSAAGVLGSRWHPA